jgi:hypothetical protein
MTNFELILQERLSQKKIMTVTQLNALLRILL